MLKRGDKMSIWNLVSGKSDRETGQDTDSERPIRFVQDGRNSWRIVYAD
jgi:hypothetical protein